GIRWGEEWAEGPTALRASSAVAAFPKLALENDWRGGSNAATTLGSSFASVLAKRKAASQRSSGLSLSNRGDRFRTTTFRSWLASDRYERIQLSKPSLAKGLF